MGAVACRDALQKPLLSVLRMIGAVLVLYVIGAALPYFVRR